MQVSENIQDEMQGYLDSIFVISRSHNTVKGYRIGINHFRQFLHQKYQCNDSEVVQSIKNGKLDVYRVLNEFNIFLVKENKKASSIKAWITAVKGYLRYHGIKVYSEDFKQLVKMPKIPRQREEPLTKEILVRLLRSLPLKVQTAVLFATASGVRLGELVQLRISDIDFTVQPTLVKIRAETTKTKEARETYLTSEATKALKDYLVKFFGWKEDKSNKDLSNRQIFGRTSNKGTHRKSLSLSENMPNPVIVAENTLASSLKLHMRKIPDLSKLNENGRTAIHFHAFRKFFRTVVGNSVGRDYAEALIGHHFYLDTYYNLHQEKRREMYLKAEPHLTISDFDKIERDLVKIAEKQREIEEYLSRNFVGFPKQLQKAYY